MLFALRRESAPFRKLCTPVGGVTLSPAPGPVLRVRLGPRELLLCETGVGPSRVQAFCDYLLQTPRPREAIFAGFAGGLVPELAVGSVVMPAEVVDEAGGLWHTSAPTARGRLLTASRLVGSAREKAELAQRHGAGAVDLESAVFARRCAEASIPFTCLRAISDDCATSLSPALEKILAGSTASTWRLARELARRPALLPELLRLARATDLAAKQLALALQAYLLGE